MRVMNGVELFGSFISLCYGSLGLKRDADVNFLYKILLDKLLIE